MVRLSEIQELGTPAVIPKTMRLTDFNNLGVAQNPVAELNPKLTQEEQPIKEKDGFFTRVDLGVQKGLGGTTSEVGKALYYFGDYIRNNQTTIFGKKPLFSTVKLGDRIANAGLRMYFRNQDALKRKFGEETGEFDFAEALGRGAVSLGAALGVGVVGGAAAAGISFGVSAKNQGFLESKEKGKSFEDADRISSMLGFAEGGLEFIGINRLLRSSGGILLRVFKGYITEFSQELSQEVAGGAIRFAEGLREFKGKESLIELMIQGLQSGSVGGILGSGASIPISIAQKAGIKEGFKKMGATDQEASIAADEVMKRGMDDVMAAVEDIEGRPLTEEEVAELGEPITGPEGEVIPVVVGPPSAETLAAVEEAKLKTTALTTEEIEILKFSEEAFPELNQQLKEAIEKNQIREQRKVQEAILKETSVAINDILAEQTEAQQITSINKLLETDFTTIEELKEGIKQFRRARAVIRKEIKETAPKIVEKRQREETILRERLRTLRTGFRKGKQITTREIQEVQAAAIKILERSDLEPAQRAKFQKFIKNLTKENFERARPELERRIEKLEEAAIKRELINRFKQLTKPSEVKNLRPEFRDAIQAIINDVTAVKPGQKKIRRLKSLAEFLEREEENEVPQSAINELRLLEQKPLADFTLAELENVVTSVATFVKLNALKNKILVKNKLREFKEIEEQAETNILKNFDELTDSVDELDTFQQQKENGFYAKVKQFLFGADSLNAEYKTEELDNQNKGVLWQVIYK